MNTASIVPTSMMQRVALAAIILVSLIPLARDPYSFGYVGGDYSFLFEPDGTIVPNHPWQWHVTLTMGLLLCAASLSVLLGHFRIAFYVLVGELLLFGGLNSFYLVRDSSLRFQDQTMLHGQEPLALTLAGLCLRLAALAMLKRSSASSVRRTLQTLE